MTDIITSSYGVVGMLSKFVLHRFGLGKVCQGQNSMGKKMLWLGQDGWKWLENFPSLQLD